MRNQPPVFWDMGGFPPNPVMLKLRISQVDVYPVPLITLWTCYVPLLELCECLRASVMVRCVV